jgi:SAM-dependent methyltransferase
MSARFTGERPGRGPAFAYDEARHRAAYLYARDLARGREVLDAGCGEGFGTVLLAETARRVLGIDYAEMAVAAARTAHRRPNLEFRRLEVEGVPALGTHFDLVTNFQVIEHLADPARFLIAVRSVLRPDGMFLLTTPNRLTSASDNPYHLREYSAPELDALLRTVFPEVTLAGLLGNERVQAFEQARARQVARLLRLDPLGVRRWLPAPVVRFAFARLSTLVRRKVAAADAETLAITPADFTVVTGSPPDAIDLVALCRA